LDASIWRFFFGGMGLTIAKPIWLETIEYIKRDIRSYKYASYSLWDQAIRNLYSHPSFAGVVFYRLGRWAWSARPSLLGRIFYFIYCIFYPLVRWYSGVELPARTQIGPGLAILHFGPTVIHPDTIAGENLSILPGITLGEAKNGTPCLGNNVAIGVGAIIIGSITIGDYVNIGAGAVVINDVPDHSTAVGNPARIILGGNSH
jgi:serine O-acetyltransferase